MATLKVKTEKGLEYIYDSRLNDNNYQPTIKINGLLKGDGNNISAAIEDEDYQTPLKVNGLVKGDNNSYSAAVENTDFLTPIDGSGLLKNSGVGEQLQIAVAQEDYALPPQVQTPQTVIIPIYGGNWYNIETTETIITLVYSSTAAGEHSNIPSGGIIKPTADTTVNCSGFSLIRGAELTNGETPSFQIKANEIWEFSNLQGYLLLKNWSEE